MAAAEAIGSEFQDGVHYVALASLTDTNLVLPAIAQSLGVQDAEVGSGQTILLERLQELIGQDKRLLVLDNFEQVIDAAIIVAELLEACPRLKVLITSREVLRLSAEYCYPVMPLSLPDLRHLPPPGFLARIEAVRLFVTRAQAVQPDFEINAENGPVVAAICHKLEGLPLAIELAAALIRLMQPETMLARLERRLSLLTGGAKDAPARHQTLRAAVGWSYDLLEPDEQKLFRSISVFAGGCTLEAISGIGHDAETPENGALLEGVTALLDKSLLRQDYGKDAEGRLYMLETIREYALEQLSARGEMDAARRAHALYYLERAEEAGPRIREPQYWNWIEQEHDNLRAALGWAAGGGDIEIGAKLGAALWHFWLRHGYLSEGWRWLDTIIHSGPELPGGLRVKLMNGAGRLALRQGEYGAAQIVLEECLVLCRELGIVPQEMQALNSLGLTAIFQNDLRRARSYFEQNLAGQRSIGDKDGISQALNNLGLALRYQGDYERATAAYEECLRVSREVPDKFAAAAPLHNLGQMLHHQGDDMRAHKLLSESLAILRQIGDRPSISVCLADIAGVWATQKQPEKAARLFGAAEALRENLRATMYDAQRLAYEWDVKQGMSQLDDATWRAAWAAGRELSMEAACELAMGEPISAPIPEQVVEKDPFGLTEREHEILKLLVEGLTYAEIADEVTLSFHTVHAHLRSIYGKMGVSSRNQATRVAMENGIG